MLAIATLLAAVLGLYVMASITVFKTSADTTWKLVPGREAGTFAITAVKRGSAEWKAGFRPGDLIELRRQQWTARAWILKPYARTPVTFVIERRGSYRSIELTFAPIFQPAKLNGMLGIGVLWMVAFAFVVSRKRPGDPEVRAICWVLLSYAIGDSFLNFSSPIPAFNALSVLCGEPGIVLSATLFSLFALHLIAPSRARRIFEYVAYLLLAISVIFALGALSAIVWGWPNPSSIAEMIHREPVAIVSRWAGLFTNEFHFLAQRTFALWCGVWAVASSRGQVRARIGWATAAMALLYGTTMLSQPFVLAGIITPAFANDLVDWGVFFVPVGLTYAVMTRRMLDTGYVVNRAAVFSVLSIVLLGSFVLVEWALTEWLHDAGRTTNILASAGLALALGLSTRFVHSRVDHVVDNVFFRERHENETAIRTFAREAPYITDASVLLQRTVAVLERHADAEFAHVLLDDGDGHYGTLNENDPAVVSLRARHEVLDLHAIDSQAQGEFAYPMVSRGRLVGVLVLGPRRSGESYAPDESAAIAQLAYSVGGAFDLLLTKNDDSVTTLRASIASLQETVASLRDALLHK
jgi:hypothetical protein